MQQFVVTILANDEDEISYSETESFLYCYLKNKQNIEPISIEIERREYT